MFQNLVEDLASPLRVVWLYWKIPVHIVLVEYENLCASEDAAKLRKSFEYKDRLEKQVKLQQQL